MLFATYVGLDAETNDKMRTGCHLIVKALSSYFSRKPLITSSFGFLGVGRIIATTRTFSSVYEWPNLPPLSAKAIDRLDWLALTAERRLAKSLLSHAC